MSNFSTSSDSNPLIPPLPARGRHPTHNRSCPDMTSPIRFATASLLAASLAFGLAACKPIDNDAKKEDKADAAAGGNDIAKSTGLKTEKEQASYMVGMSVGKSLEPIKDEVDVDTVVKAMKTVMSGGEPLLDDEQAQQVAQAFDKRLQAKQQEEQARQMAEREAQAKTTASEGKAVLAANAAKEGATTTQHETGSASCREQ